MRRSNIIFGILFLIPASVLLSIFLLLPMFMSISYSLTNWDGVSSQINFVGLRNYINVVNDSLFPQLTINTFMLVVLYVPVLNLLALLFSILTYDMVKGQNICKVFLFFPNMLSAVVVGFIWSMMYNYSSGLINQTLNFIGLGGLQIEWLGKPYIVLASISITIIWLATGFYMLIYLAGLSAIPTEIYEAAEIDGAKWLAKQIRITLPMLVNSIKTNVILSIIGVLGVFDLIFVMTAGGPINYSETIAVRIYLYSFKEMKTGKGLALAVIMSVLTMAITLFVLNIRGKREAK